MNGVSGPKIEIKDQLVKSFKNINYSQWERTRNNSKTDASSAKASQPAVTAAQAPFLFPSSRLTNNSASSNLTPERKCSAYCNHLGTDHPNKTVSKSKRQLLEEQERKNILKIKIKYARESLNTYKTRERELLLKNQDMIDYIKQTEKTVNRQVDDILRKYERYEDVKKTIHKKHFEEYEEVKQELELAKIEVKSNLSLYESQLERVTKDLNLIQELHRNLEIYKDQEYPEKLLQINNMRKKLDDLNNLHNEERDNLEDIIRSEKKLMKQEQIEKTKQIADKISKNAWGEMHYSLRDMAHFNVVLREEIEYLKKVIERMKSKNLGLQEEVNELRKDERRSTNLKTIVYDDIFRKRDICTPSMEVVLDLPKRNDFL